MSPHLQVKESIISKVLAIYPQYSEEDYSNDSSASENKDISVDKLRLKK